MLPRDKVTNTAHIKGQTRRGKTCVSAIMRRRKMPIGIQTFDEMASGMWVYVDKTALVYELANDAKHNFLSRPRRFGKSLLVSTLAAYFRGDEKLFKGLAMEKLEITNKSTSLNLKSPQGALSMRLLPKSKKRATQNLLKPIPMKNARL